MRMRLNQTGIIESIGIDTYMPYDLPTFIGQTDFYLWECLDLTNIASETAWVKRPPSPTSLMEIKENNMRFGAALLLEFLTGQIDIALDNATYRAVSETFKYAEAALRRGDIPQAKTELANIAEVPPIWTAEIKTYFVNKINTYLNVTT